jgi:hypothetical protein
VSDAFGKFRASLIKAFRNVGRTNGTAAPKSGNNVDSLMHELLVASDGASYFEARKKNAKAALFDAIDTSEVDTRVQEVAHNLIGTSVQVYVGQVYSLTCDIKRPASRMDSTKLRNALIKRGIPVKEVDKLFADSSEYSTPARLFKVVMRGDASADDLLTS